MGKVQFPVGTPMNECIPQYTVESETDDTTGRPSEYSGARASAGPRRGIGAALTVSRLLQVSIVMLSDRGDTVK